MRHLQNDFHETINLIYLIAQVIFASLFTLVIKWAQIRGKEDVVTIGCINYISAALFIFPFWVNREIVEVVPCDAIKNAMLAGGSMGAIYFVAFFFVIAIIRWVGASATTVVSVLSILIPITFAALYWKEQPNFIQIIGIALALIALLLIGASRQKSDKSDSAKKKESVPTRPWFAPIVLLVFFLMCGFSRIAQEAFKNVSIPDERPTFLLSAFVISGVPSALFLAWKFFVQKKRFLRFELLFGVMLGASNILQTHFILKCLEHFSGFIVFPVTSAGAILFTMLIAVSFLGERLSTKSCIGIAISVVALILLNWIPG